jgi:hypothetical protein
MLPPRPSGLHSAQGAQARLKSFLASKSEVDSAGNIFKICILFELHYSTPEGCVGVCISLYQIEMDNNQWQKEQIHSFLKVCKLAQYVFYVHMFSLTAQ